MLPEARTLSLWAGVPAKFGFILVSGKAGIGKTIFANYLVDILTELKYDAIKVAFANKIKSCARAYFGWDGRKDERGRRLLQHLGTEVGRAYDEDLWVKHLINDVRELPQIPDFVIVDDWRYPNEYKYFSNYSEYEVIKVRIESTRPGILEGTQECNHLSEHALPLVTDRPEYYDYVINNDGTLEELESLSYSLVNILLKRS